MAVSPGIVTLGPNDLIAGARPPFGGMGAEQASVGLFKGIAFPSGVDSNAYAIFYAGGGSIVTGFKVTLFLAEDPKNADSANHAVVFGAEFSPVATTATLDENATTGLFVSGVTENTATVTMPNTAGVIKTQTLTVTTAQGNTLAVSTWHAIRIRRNGTNASDTNKGRIILVKAVVFDY